MGLEVECARLNGRCCAGMSSLQLAFIAFTFLAPPLLWLFSRRIRSPRLANAICWTFAVLLIAAYAGAFFLKWSADGAIHLDEMLPMQLCDWAAVVTCLALLRKSPPAFELAYCWGLAGTAQALFTPAIEITFDWRPITFLIVHSIIPASVFWLMFEYKLRPRVGAYLRVMLWSQLYLGLVLVANRVTEGNYGFLSARPANPSLLDFFSDTWWIYVLQIDLTAAIAFGLLLLPWWMLCNRTIRRERASARNGTADANL
jgi:hypothetical integral membrane protein (TIGR02206 family)